MLITFESAEDAVTIKDQLAPHLPPDSLKLSTASRGFTGDVQSDLLILATALSPLVIRKLANLLAEMVRVKGQRKVSVDGVTLTGYDVDDVIKVLKRQSDPRSRRPNRP